MGRLGTLALIVLYFAVGDVKADESSPVNLDLHEGLNIVALSLINGWNRDIHNLTVTLDETKLPSWLSVVVDEKEPVTLSVGVNGESTLVLSLIVTPTPVILSTDLHIIFHDGIGNRWTIPVRVCVKGYGDYQKALETSLSENYPNPFNPTTVISFSLRESCHTTLTVYNTLGQKVRTLANGQFSAGTHSLVWDSRDDSGRIVSCGVYVYTLRAGEFVKTRRMMMVE